MNINKNQETRPIPFSINSEKSDSQIFNKEETKKLLSDLESKIDSKVENSKIKIIETLGIFVALFTFISVEFQAFRQMNNLNSIAGITLIMLGSLTFFVVILDIILSTKLSDIKFIKKEGSRFFQSAIDTFKTTFGYSEEVPFELLHCSKWGEKFKLKICLLFICFVLIGIGIYLFSKNQYLLPICR